MNNNIFRKLYIYLFAFYLICSLNPWFVWYFPIKYLVFLLSLGCSILFILSNHANDKIHKQNLIFLFFYLIVINYCYIYKVNISISTLVVSFSYVILFFIYQILTDDDKLKLKKIIINIFFYIILISLPFYILIVFLHFNLPHGTLYAPGDVYGFPFENYFFLIIGNSRFRYQSIFTEPGHLGMILAFVLYMEKFDLKNKKNLLFLIASVFTFSLASYLLIIIGIVLFSFSKGKKIIKKIFILIIIMLSLFCIGVSFYKSHPKSLLSIMILSRLEFDSSKGISGNNRNSYFFEKEYKKITKKEKVFGLEKSKLNKLIDGAGTSYKIFIVQYGYIGIILLLFLFFPISMQNRNKKYGIGCFLLFLSSFLQRPYILWPIETFLFLLSIDTNQRS